MENRIWREFVSLVSVALVMALTACGSGGSGGGGGTAPAISGTTGGGGTSPGNGGPAGQPVTLQICSSLSFTGVQWPASFTAEDQQALELALNISGSYEGADGWANLTNNFDGQGLSMGLLNQTLGTGSLQPLLIQMEQENPTVMASVFDPTRLQSLLGMLNQWQSASASPSAQAVEPKYNKQLSFLDFPLTEQASTAATAESASVTWAVNNLYTSGTDNFDPTWAAELTAMAVTPQYITIQIQAAESLHTYAISEEQQSGVHELRSYLFMFDVNVQDGGMYTEDFTDYATYLSANPTATDTARLLELMQLRLRHVLAQYVSDVESRKETIINGVGVVHEESRNLPVQYCYNGLMAYH